MADPSGDNSLSSPTIPELIELLSAAKRAFDTAMACSPPDTMEARRAEKQVEEYFTVARQRLNELAIRKQQEKFLELAEQAETLPPRMSAVNYLISLLTLASSIKPGRSRDSKTGSDPDLEGLKFQIRKLADEGCTQVEKCDRIAGSPRPAGARWSHLDWPKAIRSEKYKDAVKSWLSRAKNS